MLAAVVGLSACSVDDEDALYDNIASGTAPDVVSEFSASTEGASLLSKTTLGNGWGMVSRNENTSVNFLYGDSIAVFGKDGAKAKFVNFNGNSTSANFDGKIESNADYFALYPYQEGASVKGGVISASIPTLQHPTDDNMDGAAALSVAYTTDDARRFQFRNVTAMVSFIPGVSRYTSITLEAIDGTKIAGDVTIKVDKEGGEPVVQGGTSSIVTIDAASSADGEMRTGWGYCANIIPCTIKAGNLKITYTKPDGSTVSEVIDKEVTFKRGVCYNYGNVNRTIKVYVNGADAEPSTYYDNYVWLPYCNLEAPDGKFYMYATSPDGKPEYRQGSEYDLGAFDKLSLYPVLVDATSHKVTYDANGGKFYSDGETTTFEQQQYFGDVISCWYTPFLDGMGIVGWYSNPECTGDPVTTFSGDKDITVYAKWAKQYKIEFYDFDGNLADWATSSFLEGETQRWVDWNFNNQKSWVDEDENEYPIYSNLPLQNKDMKFYAKEAAEYKIVYLDADGKETGVYSTFRESDYSFYISAPTFDKVVNYWIDQDGNRYFNNKTYYLESFTTLHDLTLKPVFADKDVSDLKDWKMEEL